MLLLLISMCVICQQTQESITNKEVRIKIYYILINWLELNMCSAFSGIPSPGPPHSGQVHVSGSVPYDPGVRGEVQDRRPAHSHLRQGR